MRRVRFAICAINANLILSRKLLRLCRFYEALEFALRKRDNGRSALLPSTTEKTYPRRN